LHLAVAFIIAYLLNPAVNKLMELHIPRAMGAIIALLALIGLATALVVSLSPVVYQQGLLMLQKGSLYQQAAHENLLPKLMEWAANLSPDFVRKLEDWSGAATQDMLRFISNLISRGYNSSLIAIDFISMLFISPIFSFYIIKDWALIHDKALALFPLRFRPFVSELARSLDVAMAGYFRGQSYVCLIMALYYMAAFSALGLDSSVILGCASGLLIVMPYLGAATAGVLCSIMAWLQFNSGYHFLFVGAVFVVGQVLESNFISPKMIGAKIGIHPVWLMFGLIAGGSVFGFFGVLLSVPLTAASSAFIKVAIVQYKRSNFYKAEV
jgi:predicted PurR-regulated permease PerM